MKTETKGDLEGGQGAARWALGMGQPLAMPGGPLEALATASRHLFAYKLPKILILSGTELFSTKHTEMHRHLESPI